MKASELRELTEEEIMKQRNELSEELFNLKIQVATQQTTNVARIKKLRRDLARVHTVIREKELAVREK
jgi:large subunit ribosomal protein L29